MRIGLLLPSILASHTYGEGRVFAPLPLAVGLANGLVKRGHTVFFYTSGDVKTDATVIAGNAALTDKTIVYEKVRDDEEVAKRARTYDVVREDYKNALTMKAYQDAMAGKIDIIHSYLGFSAHYFDELATIPTVYTLHDPLPQKEKTVEYERFLLFKGHNYVSISLQQRNSIVPLHFVANIYHGVDTKNYQFSKTPHNDLLFIGRISPEKGVAIALEVAREKQKKLHIAASLDPADRNDTYYKEKVEPYLTTGERLEGFLSGKEKSDFLGKGKAFLFPLQWEEAFGMTMIESMACGTPVIAFARGAAPEIIEDGVTGFLVNSSQDDSRGEWVVKKTGIEGLKEAVDMLYALSPEAYAKMREQARARVENMFTVEKMVENYEAVYKKLLG